MEFSACLGKDSTGLSSYVTAQSLSIAKIMNGEI